MLKEVFIVDDFKPSLYFFQEGIKSGVENVKVNSFTNALNFLEEYKHRCKKDNRPDLIIHDIANPYIDGRKLIAEIRKLSPTQKVIVASTMVDFCYHDFLGYNVSGFHQKDSNFNTDSLVSLTNRVLSDDSTGINILVGPSGYGKSTIQDSLRQSGIHRARKITTRPYRDREERASGEIASISKDRFTYLANNGELIGIHEYRGHMYGMSFVELSEIALNDKECVFAFVEPDPALQIKYTFPGRTNLIAISPSVITSGFGLEKRLDDLTTMNVRTANSLLADYSDLKKYETSVSETKKRIKASRLESARFNAFLPLFDYVVETPDIGKACVEVFDYISRRVK